MTDEQNITVERRDLEGTQFTEYGVVDEGAFFPFLRLNVNEHTETKQAAAEAAQAEQQSE